MKKLQFPKRAPKTGDGRVFKNGTAATAMAVLALVAVVLVNLLVNALPSQTTQFDLSDSGLYSLSDATKQMLEEIEQDVNLYYLAQTGSEDPMVTALLDRYAGASSHVSWQQKDPAIYPTFAQQLGADDAAEGGLIVQCGDRLRTLSASDFYSYDYASYYTTGNVSTQFDAENQISSAILYVTSGSTPVLGRLTGHGETALNSDLTSSLSLQNMDVEDVNLLSVSEIPEDISALALICPTVDYTEADLTLLRAYLDQGGRLLVLTDPSVSTPNLNALLAEYGMSPMEGLVVEGDAGHHAQGYAYWLVPDVQTHSATSQMDGSLVLMPFAQAIQMESDLTDIALTPLLTTSSSAYNKAAGFSMQTTSREDGDQSGPFDLAVAAEKTGEDGQTSRIVWAASAALNDAQTDSRVAGGNSRFLLGCMGWLTDTDTTATLVAAKGLTSDALTFTAGQTARYGALTVALLPLALLVCGAVITLKRRAR